jgi:hypothetical protein
VSTFLGDGWLYWGEGCLSWGDEWLSCQRACIQTSLENTRMGDISKTVANTHLPAKTIMTGISEKNCCIFEKILTFFAISTKKTFFLQEKTQKFSFVFLSCSCRCAC